MGFYAEKKMEFKKIFGFFPNKDSNYIDLFIKDINLCIEELRREFLNNDKNKRYIEILVKKYYKEFNRLPNIDEEIYYYHLHLKNNNYVMPKAFEEYIKNMVNYDLPKLYSNIDLIKGDKTEGNIYSTKIYDFKTKKEEISNCFLREIIINDKKISYIIKNPFVENEDEKRLIMNFYKDKNYIKKIFNCLESGVYIDGVEKEIFKINKDRLEGINYFYRELISKNKNISRICLPIESDGIILNEIANFCFDGCYWWRPICVYVPKNYSKFSKNSFYIYYGSSELNVELEDINTINGDSYEAFEQRRCQNVKESLIKNFKEKNNFESTGELLKFYLNNKNNFLEIMRVFKNYLITGKINEENIEEIKQLFSSGVLEDYNDLSKFFESQNIEKIYIPNINSNYKLCKEDIVKLLKTKIIKSIIIPDNYKAYSDYLFKSIKEDFPNIEIKILNPFQEIDSKIIGLVCTDYYKEYMKEYLKNHTLAEWKIFTAPEKIKKDVINNPKIERITTIDIHETGNNGISKIWWHDVDEYFIWNKQENYWEYFYYFDHGSD